jgi:hypothetical protein
VTRDSKERNTKMTAHTTDLEQDLIINGEAFEGVQNFKYLGALTKS